MGRNRSLALALILASLVMGIATAELGTPVDLRCEYRIDPLGIDVAQPRLAWALTSEQRNQRQSAYQIIVSSSPDLLAKEQGDLWDSAKVDSDASIHVAYAGKALASHQQCYWKVRVWDQDGKQTAWSAPAAWTMGLLTREAWSNAQWIGLDEATTSLKSNWIWYPEGKPESDAPVGARFFRKTFDLPETAIKSAVCFFTGDNEARVYVNGKRCGDTANDFHAAVSAPIMEHLKPGRNLICSDAENAGTGPNPAGVIISARIELTDGQVIIINSDDTWKSMNSEENGWETPGYDDSGWKQAKMLGANGMDPWKEVSADYHDMPARMLRKEITADKPVRRATAYLSGLGTSELYVNGCRMGDAVLSPGATQYQKRVFYVTHDITRQITAGANVVGIWLGNGRYFAPRATEPKGKPYTSPRMLCLVRVEYEDGSFRDIVSDNSWKITANGPIRLNNEYDGETYDARKEMPGWNTPGFDESKWMAAELLEAPGGVISAQMAEPIRVTETLNPIAIVNPRPGEYVFDMGQNMVGWCRLKVNAPAGTTVRMRFAETIQNDGSIYLANIRGAKVTDEYTTKGAGDEVYEPRFTYHGFRYVEVTGYPGEPTLDILEGLVVHDDVAPAGAFQCSNKLVNQIAKNIRWGTRGNYRSMPTDCPQRDERQGWLGDRSEESHGESYLFNISGLYGKWVGDMADSQRDDGSISDVCPAYWPLYNDNVTWPCTFIVAPGMLYKQYGDKRILEKHYDAMKKWILYMQKYLDNGILPKDNYGDWCVPPEEQHLIHSNDPARKTPGDFLGTSFYYHCLMLMSDYANVLGKQQDVNDFRALAEIVKTAFNKKFLDEGEAKYANGAETTCVLPLAFGLAPDSVREKLFGRLVDHIMNVGKGHLATGLVGGQFLMRTLSDNGRPDVAFTITTQTSYPSWGYMIDKNATTIWELWNGDTADPAMNSHNHVMLVGDLNTWFYEYLGGIRAASPGFKQITLRPYIEPGLQNVEASHKSPYGTIYSRWRTEKDRLFWQVTIPANTTARVYVPATDAAKVTESGKALADMPELRLVEVKDGAVVLDAGSGQYSFEVAR